MTEATGARSETGGPEITLASYTVRVRRKYNADNLPLDDFSGTDTMLEFVTEFVEGLRNDLGIIEASRSLLRVVRVSPSQSTTVGIIEAGVYGLTADLVNVETHEHSYTRKTQDAELLPFYFLFNAPRNTDKGILIVQRHGVHGMYTALTAALRAAFDLKYPQHTLDIKRHVPRAVLELLLQGQVKTIEVTGYELSDDLADRVRYRGRKANVGEVTITIKAKKDTILPFPNWARRKSNGNLLETADGGVKERVRVTLTYNGKQRVVDLGRLDDIAPYIDISSDVRIGRDGHPTFDSVDAAAKSLLIDLAAEIGRPAE